MSYFEEEHVSRSFRCGWRPRGENAEAIARRVRDMASALGEVAEYLGRLWPQFEARAMRASDPGPVLELTTADLGRLIDQRSRFDPPQPPAPCGPKGYSFVLVGNVFPLRKRQTVGFNIHAGSVEESFENEARLALHSGSVVWRDVQAGVRVLDAMVEAWDADWALASGSLYDEATDRMWIRPWLKWVREGKALQAILLSRIEIPLNGETATHGDGDLVIWP